MEVTPGPPAVFTATTLLTPGQQVGCGVPHTTATTHSARSSEPKALCTEDQVHGGRLSMGCAAQLSSSAVCVYSQSYLLALHAVFAPCPIPPPPNPTEQKEGSHMC